MVCQQCKDGGNLNKKIFQLPESTWRSAALNVARSLHGSCKGCDCAHMLGQCLNLGEPK